MKISKSKQELARIISENGGWRDGAEFSAQDADGEVFHYSVKPTLNKGSRVWHHRGCIGSGQFSCDTLKNWHQAILSRDEYFYLYPAPDADGWIEWNGGKCPVDGDALVDWKVRSGIEHTRGEAASRLTWSDCGSLSIIAYRLHKPEQAEAPTAGESPEQRAKLARIYAPTLDQLLQDWRNRRDYAEHLQKEADEAMADAEARLGELVAAGRALGLVLSVTAPEPELAITDWRDLRVGDIIRCVGKWQDEDTDGAEFEVSDIEHPQYDGELAVMVEVPDVGCAWGKEFEFIRRP